MYANTLTLMHTSTTRVQQMCKYNCTHASGQYANMRACVRIVRIIFACTHTHTRKCMSRILGAACFGDARTHVLVRMCRIKLIKKQRAELHYFCLNSVDKTRMRAHALWHKTAINTRMRVRVPRTNNKRPGTQKPASMRGT